MTPDPDTRPTSRRSFFGLAGSAALLCTIGGEKVVVDSPDALRKADATAARVRRPQAAAAQAVPQIQPAPGGVRREYWIQAQTQRWRIVPSKRDDWHDRSIPGKTTYRAYMYTEMTPGFAAPKHGPSIPGPTLYAEVGDVLVVHFRNADRTLRQAVTMHPHGVKYNPEYDGAYMGQYTRAGGFVGPGETFTYQWECTPESVGSWPYHDHGPEPHAQHVPRAVRDDPRPPEGRAAAGRPLRAVRTPAAAAGDGPGPQLPVHQRPLLRRQHADAALAGGPAGRAAAFGMDDNFHTFHIHGHRWRDPAGTFVDNPSMGPNESVTARFVEDNPGRWLYHCHVFSHQDNGMAGWYVVDP